MIFTMVNMSCCSLLPKIAAPLHPWFDRNSLKLSFPNTACTYRLTSQWSVVNEVLREVVEPKLF